MKKTKRIQNRIEVISVSESASETLDKPLTPTQKSTCAGWGEPSPGLFSNSRDHTNIHSACTLSRSLNKQEKLSTFKKQRQGIKKAHPFLTNVADPDQESDAFSTPGSGSRIRVKFFLYPGSRIQPRVLRA
jgi:hypothetical protein